MTVVRFDPKHSGQRPAGTPLGTPAAVIVVRPDGSSSEISLGGDPGVLTWGAKWLAVMEETEGTIFVDPGSGSQSVLKGWRPLTWSPKR